MRSSRAPHAHQLQEDRIVLLGSLNTDLMVTTPKTVQPGETILSGPVRFLPGGKGANQATGAARLGASVSMLGCVGDDKFGSELCHNLRKLGVSDRRIRVVPEEYSGVAFVSVSQNCENAIVVAPGANYAVDAHYIATNVDIIQDCAIAVTQLETPITVVEEFARICARYNVPLMVNIAPYQPLPIELLQACHYVVANATEASALTGVTVCDRSDAVSALYTASALGLKNLVLTLGSAGCVAVTEQRQIITLDGYKVESVDSTGAGDAFVGALSVALARGEQLPAAMRFAAAAGALSSTVHGAQAPAVLPHEISRLMRAQDIAIGYGHSAPEASRTSADGPTSDESKGGAR